MWFVPDMRMFSIFLCLISRVIAVARKVQSERENKNLPGWLLWSQISNTGTKLLCLCDTSKLSTHLECRLDTAYEMKNKSDSQIVVLTEESQVLVNNRNCVLTRILNTVHIFVYIFIFNAGAVAGCKQGRGICQKEDECTRGISIYIYIYIFVGAEGRQCT